MSVRAEIFNSTITSTHFYSERYFDAEINNMDLRCYFFVQKIKYLKCVLDLSSIYLNMLNLPGV